MEAGIRVIATQWRINGLANLSKLSEDVIDFCRGMRIYKVQEYSKDTAKVIKSKRIIILPLMGRYFVLQDEVDPPARPPPPPGSLKNEAFSSKMFYNHKFWQIPPRSPRQGRWIAVKFWQRVSVIYKVKGQSEWSL